jgi:putative transposase
MTEKRQLVNESSSPLSLRQRCSLMSMHRSNLYYEPQPTSEADLALMKVIDGIYLRLPFYGSRRMSDELAAMGRTVNRKRVQRLMRLMGLEALAPKPNLSKCDPGHRKYPYLLRHLEVTRANQVWATDITYIPLASGFVYLVAIIDWYSRAVLAWRLSNTMDVAFCVEALEEALERYGQPEIFNSDQGAQFTSEVFTGVLLKRGIQISMDGKGRCLDNVFVERLWRSLKYEEVYLHAYEKQRDAWLGIGRYLKFFNTARRHQGLKSRIPMEVYKESMRAQGASASASPPLRRDNNRAQPKRLTDRQHFRGARQAA